MRVNSNPARLINSSLMYLDSCLTFFHRLSVHLVGQVGKAHIAVLLLKWSSVIPRPEWKSNKLLPGQLPSSSRKSSTSHDSANFYCKAKLVDKKACLVKSSKVISLNNQLSWSVLALTSWWHFLHWITENDHGIHTSYSVNSPNRDSILSSFWNPSVCLFKCWNPQSV